MNFFENAGNFNSSIAKSLIYNQHDFALEIKAKLEVARNSYPAQFRQSLDGRLRDFNKFRGAAWELYFWGLLNAHGCEVMVETASGVGAKSIDFSWKSNNAEIWLEVTSRSISPKEQKIRETQNTFYEEMASELMIRNCIITISLKVVTETKPDIKFMVRKIEEHLARLDPFMFQDRFEFRDPTSGWEISVIFGSKVTKEFDYAPLILEPIESEDLDFGDYRHALSEKFAKFSETKGPINIVALVGSGVSLPSAFDAVQILYGTPSLRISINEESSENVLTDLSFFSWGNEAFSYIFAVILGFGDVPGFSSLVKPIICLNPNSCHEFDPKLIPLEAQVIRLTTSGFEKFDRESNWIPLNIFD